MLSVSNLQYCDEITPQQTALAKHLVSQGYTYMGHGRHRAGFLCPSGRFVIKVPIAKRGVQANKEEAQRYKEDSERYAKCRLFHYQGIPCLIMEKVEKVTNWEDWAKIERDNPWLIEVDRDSNGCQAGFNRKDKVVAYDYSIC